MCRLHLDGAHVFVLPLGQTVFDNLPFLETKLWPNYVPDSLQLTV